VKLAPTAEWPSGLGKGLQSPVHGFDSRLRLHQDLRSAGPLPVGTSSLLPELAANADYGFDRLLFADALGALT
jgi:hypothetical protein